MKIIDDFEKKTRTDLQKEIVTMKCGNKVPIYTIETINNLIQYIGYGKYKNCKTEKVFIRGQIDTYNYTLVPSLYRQVLNTDRTAQSFYQMVNQVLKLKSFEKFPKSVLTATLQHYGIKTPQIDVVDNLWIALWFAANEFHGTIINSTEHLVVTPSSQKYGYIYLIASDAINTTEKEGRGTYKGDKTTLIDLRSALPSYYLRPHAQHAYMLMKNNYSEKDYSDLVVGIAKIPIDKINKWIGNTELLSVNTLFPSAYYDFGYQILLKNFPAYDASVVKYRGSIQVVS